MALHTEKLSRFLYGIIDGKRVVHTQHDATLFITAICDQKDPLQCLAHFCSKASGLTSLRTALWMDPSSSEVLNGRNAQAILYFAKEDLRQINNGRMLCELLTAIVEPPLVWDAYKTAFTHHELTDEGLRAFASLVVELLALLSPTSNLAHSLAIKSTAQNIVSSRQLHQSESVNVRQLAYKIEESLRVSSLPENGENAAIMKPGGRHDNDLANFRLVSIFPSKDELLSKEAPYLLTAAQVLESSPKQRVHSHLDNQFRLLREDMLAELRENIKVIGGDMPGSRKHTHLRNMQFYGINCFAGARSRSGDKFLRPAAVAFRCFDRALAQLPESEPERKKFFADDTTFLKHGSFGCLLVNTEVVAFATIERDVDLLAKTPSILLLRIMDNAAVRTALMTLKLRKPHEIGFVVIDTPYFAYEPILRRLKSIPALPLADTILQFPNRDIVTSSPFGLEELAARVGSLQSQELKTLVGSPHSIRLDAAQTASLTAILTQKVAMIQGPPGTGKSLLGAIATKLLLEHVSNTTILILCYTNHALDQFLEDLLDMGVALERMLRLGSKSTPRTEPMKLSELRAERARLPQAQWNALNTYKSGAQDSAEHTSDRGIDFSRWKVSDMDLLDHLEFSDSDSHFFLSFLVPETDDGMTTIGAGGRAIGPSYLLQRWRQGKDPGLFKNQIDMEVDRAWRMSLEARQECLRRWEKETVSERAMSLADLMQEYDSDLDKWASARNNKIAELMKSRRIIGCTTTAAAKYADQINSTKPGIVLVEEAGEVLESHILSAMSSETKQLIMIGDHCQLRPKIKNYALTVERGDGFDLNCSLFERLVIAGHPHTVLQKQHRMRPQISAFVRRLMYPKLEDGNGVLSRPDILGLQENLVFINHGNPEVSDKRLKDRLDEMSTVSRQNVFEARMILKTVKYLAQQGYGTDKQVVLTPYLGQLRLIMDELKQDHDPVLGDLDSHDLVKAGLLTVASATVKKRPLRISTIDNFQGEESDIVIASLTRSNKNGDIGFMNEPERLNVLLSRARNGLIIIGNAETFKKSKSGRKVWQPFFEQLVEAKQFFDGLPVRCGQHPDRVKILETPERFEELCPNGGCDEHCRSLLACGKHRCPERCHQQVDHSKQKCLEMVERECHNNHRTRVRCWQSSQLCSKCERDSALLKKRQQRQDEYLRELIDVEDKIAHQRQIAQDLDEQTKHSETLKQKQNDLVQATRIAQQKSATPKKAADSASTAKTERAAFVEESKFDDTSEARKIWQSSKEKDGAENPHIDAIMDIIGLEAVKNQVLNVKDKVDTSLRQNADLCKERFNVLLLGNPGTGKTTIARHYAKCLSSMGVVSGEKVVECTASKLMFGGVAGYKKQIDEILNDGGGAMFVDEAYQLSQGTNATGSQVLDAIMDDAENLTGKIFFILAGYRKEMEGLLAHNPGLKSRFLYEFAFDDYEDDQLLRILQQQVHRRFEGRMKIEDGVDGLYARIAARRVGYGRGRPGFGNARAVENTLGRILARQAARLSKSRRKGDKPDDFCLSKEDMLGPEPSSALQSSKAWAQLQSLIGLETVKQSVRGLMHSLRSNYERELAEEPLLQFNLNRVFLGSPGTGKTTVANLFGQILVDLGLLSSREVVIKNPADFCGDVLGASEKITKGILSSTVGKVLVIDEAYGLGSSSATGQSADPYKTAVIDTLVAEIQSVPGDDRCVLLLGYAEQMENMMRTANPGLERRFPLAEAFVFEDFSDDELIQIVKLKLKQQACDVTDDGMQCLMECLKRARNKIHFGNAGEVDILLNTAKQRHLQRIAKGERLSGNVLEAIDFDPDFNQVSSGLISIARLFENTVGQEAVISRFQQIQNVVRQMRARGLDPREQVPYNFVFCGPPGTGKTTTARKIGQIYHDLGILATNEVLERSASDLIGQYVGQTGTKTKALLQSALGRVLLIDEAYRLATGPYAKEAVDELVDLLTKPQFSKKLIFILAGYDRDIEVLMTSNPGLTSRFPERLSFGNLPATSCIELLVTKLKGETYLDASEIVSLSSWGPAIDALQELIDAGTWANARDVETLSKQIARDLLQDDGDSGTGLFKVTRECVMEAVQGMTRERQKRGKLLPTRSMPDDLLTSFAQQQIREDEPSTRQERSTRSVAMSSVQAKGGRDSEQIPEVAHQIENQETSGRDVGVSDEVWEELEADKQKAAEEEKKYADVVAAQEELERLQGENDGNASSSEDENEEDEARRAARLKREQERIRYEILRREKEEMEERRKHEQRMQQRLRRMGVCEQGFQWIKQGTGYRCAGGSHFVSEAALSSS